MPTATLEDWYIKGMESIINNVTLQGRKLCTLRGFRAFGNNNRKILFLTFHNTRLERQTLKKKRTCFATNTLQRIK